MTNKLPEKPEPRRRRLLGPGALDSFEVRLRTVTPILGGAAVPRTVDAFLRAPSIRGQLRFWWRALYGHSCATPRALAAAEAALWGHASAEGGRRSPVEVWVSNVAIKDGRLDNSNPSMGTPAGYALWPARAPKGGRPAPRWGQGVAFTVHVRCPVDRRREVEDAVRAWVLFGGYGARVRRGCGSLTVVGQDANRWLPAEVSLDALSRLFGATQLFGAASGSPTDTPSLHGARLLYGRPVGAPVEGPVEGPDKDLEAWATALEWLRDFRQSPPARDPPPPEPRQRNRPGRSHWPEADKVRGLSGRGPWAHQPRNEYGSQPAWPRAGFGLPIVGQFQREDRYTKEPYRPGEPNDFELRWKDADGEPHSRLASPLILKPLPLADGRFVPIALWLYRRYPQGGRVFLLEKPRQGEMRPVRGSEAPFDRLLGAGDKSLFRPLDGKSTLRDAFLDWLVEAKQLRKLTP